MRRAISKTTRVAARNDFGLAPFLFGARKPGDADDVDTDDRREMQPSPPGKVGHVNESQTEQDIRETGSNAMPSGPADSAFDPRVVEQ